MGMATPPREQHRRGGTSGSASRNANGRVTQRLPFRSIGAPLRYPAAPSQHELPLPIKTVRRSMAHFVRAAFINRNFALLWWGQAISTVGDYAWDTALVLWVASFLAAGQSWAPLAVSGVVLAAALPQVVVGPIAGVFVDRWDKRRTMIVMAVLQAIIATLLVLAALHIPFPYVGNAQFQNFGRIIAVYIDVVALSICAQFFVPAQFALIKDIVPEHHQDKALETSQAIQGLAVIIGPPVAAALVFGLGVGWALVLDAASFVIVVLAIFAIQSPPSAHSLAPGEAGHFSREFLDGVGYVVQHRVLRTILVAEVLTWLGFGALQSLGYFFITENLHAPASDYGLLGADFGVGAIAGALLVTFVGQRIGLERLLWVALVTSGFFVIVMSHLTSLYPALVAAFLFGVSTTAIIVTAGPLALHGTSREFVGRVMAVINPLGRLAALISVVLAGYFASTVLQGFHASLLGITFGPVDTVFTGMGLLAVIGGVYARISLGDTITEAASSSEEPLSGANEAEDRLDKPQQTS